MKVYNMRYIIFVYNFCADMDSKEVSSPTNSYTIKLAWHAGTLLAAIMTAIPDHKPSSWRLSCSLTLLAPVYSVSLLSAQRFSKK